MTSTATRPEKASAVQQFVSRFNKTTAAVGRPVGLIPQIEEGGNQQRENCDGGTKSGKRSRKNKSKKSKANSSEESDVGAGSSKGKKQVRRKRRKSSDQSRDDVIGSSDVEGTHSTTRGRVKPPKSRRTQNAQ